MRAVLHWKQPMRRSEEVRYSGIVCEKAIASMSKLEGNKRRGAYYLARIQAPVSPG